MSKSHIADLTKSVVEFYESHQTSIEHLTQFDEFSNSFFACILKCNGMAMKINASSQEFTNDLKRQINCIDVLSFALEIEKNQSSSILLCKLINQIDGENKSRHFVRGCEHEFYLQVINEDVLIYDMFSLSGSGKSRYSHTTHSVGRLLNGLEQFKRSVIGVCDNIFISPIVARSLGADATGPFLTISSEHFINLYDE